MFCGKSLIHALLRLFLLAAPLAVVGCTLQDFLGAAYYSAADHECRQANDNRYDEGPDYGPFNCVNESELNNIRYQEDVEKIATESGNY